MAHGAGKYDDECTLLRSMTGATGVAVIIIDGTGGHGFSVQMPPHELVRLPYTLEAMAKQIRLDLQTAGLTNVGEAAPKIKEG